FPSRYIDAPSTVSGLLTCRVCANCSSPGVVTSTSASKDSGSPKLSGVLPSPSLARNSSRVNWKGGSWEESNQGPGSKESYWVRELENPAPSTTVLWPR